MNLVKFFNSLVITLPSSKAITLNWNYGSMLGMVLIFQILSGTLLALYYSNDFSLSFDSVQYIMYEVNYGWVFRVFHFNGASLFFIFIYLHFFKGLFFSSYRLKKVWSTGVLILFLMIVEAFMGYVLVWAQMSFWASVVITSLLTVIPFWGELIVMWVWSGFTVSGATLKFFFVLHFLLPWFFLVLVMVHLLFLHETGSTSSLFCHGDYDKIFFYLEFWVKDLMNIIIWLLFIFFSLVSPFLLGDPEMFVEANTMMSPVHIVPEWYFLFVYAILRAIPDKVVGVIALLASILVFFIFVFINNYKSGLTKINKFLVFNFIFTCVMLSWLGRCVVEFPFTLISVFFSVLYFFWVLLMLLNFYLVGGLFS
uniref:Cytochrome b n=1 Tax=Cucullanus robustus TaxID=657293 RepID=G4V248_9BILA|nr:cytochrome b [Cucullanus robustus]ACV96765.1 cytochrome b [Cucullanus robustus]